MILPYYSNTIDTDDICFILRATRMVEKAKKIILVVDDISENIDLIHHIFSGEYKVVAAMSGEDALELLQGGLVPALVITDINMPGISGYEVCSYIRSKTGIQNTPVIFISGLFSEELMKVGVLAGGNDFIKKPFSISELREKANILLNPDYRK